MSANVYRSPKSFLSSKTIRFNGVLLAIAAFLAALPETIATSPFSDLVALLPERYREVLAAVIGVIAAVNVLLRLVTKQPVKAPSIGSKAGIGVLIAAIAIGGVSCGTSGATPGAGVTSDYSLPSFIQIVTPEHAETAVYVGVKVYQITVGTVNELYALGKITPERHQQLVAGPDSYARKLQASLQIAFDLSQRWRAGQATRQEFGNEWVKAGLYLSELQRAKEGS